MADKIKKQEKANIAYLTDVTSGVSTYGRVIKDPHTGTARIYVVARSNSDISTNTILALIPDGYRPKTVTAIYGFIITSSNVNTSYYGTVETDGRVLQNLTTTARACFFCGEYEV